MKGEGEVHLQKRGVEDKGDSGEGSPVPSFRRLQAAGGNYRPMMRIKIFQPRNGKRGEVYSLLSS